MSPRIEALLTLHGFHPLSCTWALHDLVHTPATVIPIPHQCALLSVSIVWNFGILCFFYPNLSPALSLHLLTFLTICSPGQSAPFWQGWGPFTSARHIVGFCPRDCSSLSQPCHIPPHSLGHRNASIYLVTETPGIKAIFLPLPCIQAGQAIRF